MALVQLLYHKQIKYLNLLQVLKLNAYLRVSMLGKRFQQTTFEMFSFLARLNNIHGELLYYPWRWRPQMLKFLLKFLRPHYFLTLSPICFIFSMMIHIGPKFCAVPSPPL